MDPRDADASQVSDWKQTAARCRAVGVEGKATLNIMLMTPDHCHAATLLERACQPGYQSSSREASPAQAASYTAAKVDACVRVDGWVGGAPWLPEWHREASLTPAHNPRWP